LFSFHCPLRALLIAMVSIASASKPAHHAELQDADITQITEAVAAATGKNSSSIRASGPRSR